MPASSTTEIKSVMDIAKKFQEDLKGKSSGKETATSSSATPTPSGKPSNEAPGPIEQADTSGISDEEIALFKGKKEPEPDEGNEDVQAIIDAKIKEALKDLPYETLEDVMGGYKNLQRKYQEVQDKLKSTPEINKELIRKEFQEMFGKKQTQDETAKKLKELEEEDPDEAKLMRLELSLTERMSGIEKAMKSVNDFIQKKQESEEIDGIQANVKAAAEKAGLPYRWLLSIATTAPYDSMSLEEVVPVAKKELKKMMGEFGVTKSGTTTKAPEKTRAPDTRGSAGSVKTPLTVEDLHEPGSREFTEETIPKMIEAFMLRHPQR